VGHVDIVGASFGRLVNDNVFEAPWIREVRGVSVSGSHSRLKH
jgi:hypothetical protein